MQDRKRMSQLRQEYEQEMDRVPYPVDMAGYLEKPTRKRMKKKWNRGRKA
ncbi:hypothetical protein [Desulfonatronum parangueonense]